jgi:hypothetical protein
MVVPAIGVVIKDDNRRALPERRPLDCVDRIHQECLFVDRIRVAGMAILVRSGFQVADSWEIAGGKGREKIAEIVLVIRLIRLTDRHLLVPLALAIAGTNRRIPDDAFDTSISNPGLCQCRARTQCTQEKYEYVESHNPEQ